MTTMKSACGGALLALLFGHSAMAQERTWYVYCEGYGHGMHWAVFSQNMWPHDGSDNYARKVALRAEMFIEEKHDLPLQGCSGVNFLDMDQADHSRQRTELLHRKMGDQVHYFNLPADLLVEK